MTELEAYLHVIRRCDANIAQIEASIHALAATYEKSLRIKEQELVRQISTLYGEETNEFIKRREELDEYFEQIQNTCSLTELVIHGKDIELLLVKKQLMEKFRELDAVELDPLPENICMRIDFQPGELHLGTLKICEMTPMDDDEREGELDDGEEDVAKQEDEEAGEEEEDEEDVDETEVKREKPVRTRNANYKASKTYTSIATQTEDLSTATQAVQVRPAAYRAESHLILTMVESNCAMHFRRWKNLFLHTILALKMVVFQRRRCLSKKMVLYLPPPPSHPPRHLQAFPPILTATSMNRAINYRVASAVS